MNTSIHWKKGRGKLGIFDPLFGKWESFSQSPMGRVRCVRKCTKVLGEKYVELAASWKFGEKLYEEKALFGVADGEVCFWSFTSDGKHSIGMRADGSDIHSEAISFEAQMPAGLARMTYWPDAEGGFYWAVESKIKKGWNRFIEHHYKRMNDAESP